MARPPLVLDLTELEKLAALQCTQAEVAAWFGCSERTIGSKLRQPRYRDAWERGREKGRTSLRRAQFQLAQHNAAMAIFLGKNYLGQRDHRDDASEAPLIPKDSIIIRIGGPPETSPRLIGPRRRIAPQTVHETERDAGVLDDVPGAGGES